MARHAPRRLYRSPTERMLGGVCGGLAEYFDVDPVLMRLAFVAGTVLSGGVGLPLYVVLWIIVPREGESGRVGAWERGRGGTAGFAPGESSATGVPPGVAGPESAADAAAGRPTTEPTYSPAGDYTPAASYPDPYADEPGGLTTRRQAWAGGILVLLGLWLLADNFNLLRWVRGDLIWAALLIGVGAWLLLRQSRGRV